MAQTMKAAVLREFGQPLSVESMPKPVPLVGEALVKIMASGLCMTDCHIQDGVIASVKLPYIPGHEMAGIIEAFGLKADQDDLAVGDHVVCGIDMTCGVCPLCRMRRENLCRERVRIGFERNGSHAEYAVVPVRNLHKIADHVPFEQAAILPDAIACMYHAIIDCAHAKEGLSALVFGVGGLGLQGIQMLKNIGCSVLAAGRTDAKLEMAQKLGADTIINTRKNDLVSSVLAATGGLGCDLAFDLAGTGNFDELLQSVRPGGKIIALAYAVDNFQGNFQEMVIKEKEIIGVRGSTTQNLLDCIRMVEEGMLLPVVTATYSLDQINEALASLRTSGSIGRSVLKMA